MIDKQSIYEGMKQLGQVFNKPLKPGDVDLIHELMNDKGWTAWEFQQAVRKCIEECRFMPRPKELLERYEKDPEKVKAKKYKPEQLSYTAQEDAELERMIGEIENPKLRGICRRILKKQSYEKGQPWEPAPF